MDTGTQQTASAGAKVAGGIIGTVLIPIPGIGTLLGGAIGAAVSTALSFIIGNNGLQDWQKWQTATRNLTPNQKLQTFYTYAQKLPWDTGGHGDSQVARINQYIAYYGNPKTGFPSNRWITDDTTKLDYAYAKEWNDWVAKQMAANPSNQYSIGQPPTYGAWHGNPFIDLTQTIQPAVTASVANSVGNAASNALTTVTNFLNGTPAPQVVSTPTASQPNATSLAITPGVTGVPTATTALAPTSTTQTILYVAAGVAIGFVLLKIFKK